MTARCISQGVEHSERRNMCWVHDAANQTCLGQEVLFLCWSIWECKWAKTPKLSWGRGKRVCLQL